MLFVQLTKMWKFSILFCLINTTNSASIKNTENKLELIKEDILQVGNTVNQFVFDLLDDILDTSSSEEKLNSIVKQREKRQTSTITTTFDGNKELETLCKHFNHHHNCLPTIEKINEMRNQVRTLEKSIDLLNNQQSYNLNKTENSTIINHLNRAKQLLHMERLKSEILEKELTKQKTELSKLDETFKEISGDNRTKNFSDSILGHNFTERIRSNNNINNMKINELKQLLSDINNNDDNMIDSTEIQTKILELEKRLKRRRNDKLIKEIREIEQQLKDTNSNDDDRFEKSLERILIRPPQSKTDDVKSLQDLENAINRLRPKEDTNNQFQTIFNRLITRPTRQQDDIRKIMNYNNNNRPGPNLIPYMCMMDDGRNDNVQQFYGPPPSPPPAPQVQQILFPNSYDQYRDDLRNQIDNLQMAVNDLNKPEIVQNSNDKAIITNLEVQINELRNMLNQTQIYRRSKRSTDANNANNNDHPTNENDRNQTLNDIQNRINKIRNELGKQQQQQQRSSTNPPIAPYNNAQDLIQNLVYNFKEDTELKSSGTNDIFTEIISKIIDKILAAIPVIVRKLFNFSVSELTSYDNYNQSNYDMLELFRNLGIFGYLPVILIRILSGLGNFFNILRHNKFFRTLLLPIIILGTVSGSILFLNWFLQPDDTQYISYDYNNNNYVAPSTYSKGYLN